MHASGAKQATEHLLGLGHRRIAAIAGQKHWYATEERLLGMRAALAGAGILADPQLIRFSDWQEPSGVAAAEELLSLPEPPTAIFAFNDNVAIGALNAARARGLRIPDDLSIVGFDDTAQATIIRPQLTTVRQPLAELGRTGVSLLTRLIEGQRLDALRMELSTTLVVRGHDRSRPREERQRVESIAVGAVVVAAVLVGLALAARGSGGGYVLRRLVTDRTDPQLVNAWGLAASSTGPVVDVERGARLEHALLRHRREAAPHGARRRRSRPASSSTAAPGFVIHGGGRSDPARFIYACEDGKLRAWTPTVPDRLVDARPSSPSTTPASRRCSEGSRSRARGSTQPTSTTRRWTCSTTTGGSCIRRAPSVDPSVPAWYAPFGIAVLHGHVFVTYAFRAPVNGNDAPSGGYVDEFTLDGRLVSRLPRGDLNEPWGMTFAPQSFGRYGGDLLVGNFGDGTIDAFAPRRERLAERGQAATRPRASRSSSAASGRSPSETATWPAREGRCSSPPARTPGAARPSSPCTACSARSRPPRSYA